MSFSLRAQPEELCCSQPPPLPSGNPSLQLKRDNLAEAAVFRAVLGNPRVNRGLLMDRVEYGPGPDSPIVCPPTLSLLED